MAPDEPDSTLRLEVLGTPCVVLPSGEDAGLPLGKPLAALCYVALETTRVTRDDLATVLWSGAPESRGRQSVRQALWMLRKAAGDEIVVEEEGALRVGDAVVTDLEALSDALGRGDLEAAWDQWHGGPLQRLAVPDSPAFQAWVDGVRSRWEMRFGEALLARAEAENEPAERLAWIERALEVQPYSRTLHESRVRALLEQRDVEGAEAALAEARAVVGEAGAGVFDQLGERLRALRRTRFAAEGGDETRLVPEFVGRAEEFSRLAGLWRSALSGRPRVAAVVGPMGIGKTRLADEFIALAESDGARIISVKAVETERTLELGVAGSLVRHLLRMPGGAGISAASAQALQHLVPSSGNGLPPAGPHPSPAAMADAVEDLVEAVAHEVPLVVLVDDLQWVDPASRTLVLRLARTLQNSRALLLILSRTREGDGGALRALRALEERERAAVVELGPLTRAEIGEMVGLLLGDGEEPSQARTDRLVAHIVDLSAGIPLAVVEILRNLADREILVGSAEGWRLVEAVDVESVELPTSISDLLAARLGALGDDELELLGLLARSARAPSPATLADRSDLDDARFERALHRLRGRHLVRDTRGGGVGLAHDSLRDPVLERAGRTAGSGRKGPSTGGAPVVRVGGLGGSPGGILVALALLVIVLAVALRDAAPTPTSATGDPPPVGTIQVNTTGDRLVLVEFAEDGTPVQKTVRIPRSVLTGAATARVTPAGDTLLMGTVGSQERAPDVIEVRPDGSAEVMFAREGDDTPSWGSWSERWAVVQSQEDPAERFRLAMVVVDRQTGRPRTVLRPGYVPSGADLARDGRSFVTLTETFEGPDSVIVFTPAGRIVEGFEVERNLYQRVLWCGDDLLGIRFEPGRVAEAVVIDRSTREATPLALPLGAFDFQADCSPDGRHIATVDEAGTRLRILERSGMTSVASVPLPGRSTLVIHWQGDEHRALPTRLEVVDTVRRIPWGGRARLLARAVQEDGKVDTSGVALRSLDPTVIRTTSDSIVGIRPGIGRVEVSARDWILDTLAITVTGEVQETALLTDPLEALDPDVWPYQLGDGFARSVEFDGERVVELGSDPEARYWDGWASRELPSSPTGLTVEVEFRIDVTRDDKQGFALYVAHADPPAEVDRRDWYGEWDTHAGVILRYPGQELGDFDPEMATLWVDRVFIERLPLPDIPLPDDRWTQLTIQIAPDGLVSILIDGRPVTMQPLRTDLIDSGPPRIFLQSRAVDTRLFVRNLVVWPGVRYEAPQGADGG